MSVPTSAQLAELTRLAEAAAHQAYAPYSRFLVGASVLLDGGEFVAGCNVENASYRLTTCAEQATVVAAVALYGPRIRVQAIAVHTVNASACQPCGACRQTLAEFADPAAIILFAGPGGNPVPLYARRPSARSVLGHLAGNAYLTMPIHPLDVILHKRDGLVLTDAEIQAFIRAVVQRNSDLSDENVSDPQIAAFLMAVFVRGLNAQELAALTQAMRFSGEVFDSNSLNSFTVDKHSTGGVGDKTSLLIAPILAAAGVAHPTSRGEPGICVPMISGRSLGHTGGTLDKLETIPDFDTQLSLARFEQVLRQCGAALIGQTPHLVPADRILYALRDHTGTVESPHLIAASIMSKKLAEDLDALVLDVKTGSGAFLKSYEDAHALAELMVATGNEAGTRTVALITQMDQPLGRYAGNWVEVLECIDILQGRRHPLSGKLIELTNVLSGWMLHLAGRASTPAAGAELADSILSSGAAYKQWLAIVAAQGGDISIFINPSAFHRPRASTTVKAESSGFLSEIDCTQAGWAVQRLGAGRLRPDDPVSAHAGIEVHACLGDRVKAGQPLVTLFAEDDSLLVEPLAILRAAYRISAHHPQLQPIVREVVQMP